MSVIQITKILKIEKDREHYAEINDKENFLKLYKKNILKFPNENTSHLWEKELLNQSKIDNMTNDRIIITSNEALKLIKIRKYKSVFDLGIGKGFVEKNIIKTYPLAEITGLDFTEANLDDLSMVIKKFTPIKASFNDFIENIRIKTYDLVLALEVMEHIDPDKTFLVYKKIKQIMKIDGTLILSVPVNEDLYEKIISKTNYSAHVRRYTEKLIKYELDLAGFEILNEKKLYAFQTQYKIKSLLSEITGFRKPNVMIFICRKK